MYVTEDGVNFTTLTTNGFNDPYNHGLRTFAVTNQGLCLGTANPFYGCQVWIQRKENSENPIDPGTPDPTKPTDPSQPGGGNQPGGSQTGGNDQSSSTATTVSIAGCSCRSAWHCSRLAQAFSLLGSTTQLDALDIVEVDGDIPEFEQLECG